MTNCAKCGAELIGSKKFCAACGTPVTDPRAVGSSPGNAQGAPASVYGGAPPPSQPVNPFAATAFPAKKERPSMYGPPPEAGRPVPAAGAPPPQGPASQPRPRAEDSQGAAVPQVSPLAVSNALSMRPAEVSGAISAAKASGVPPSGRPRPPGTAQMPTFPTTQQSAPSPAPAPAGRPKVAGTQMMNPASFPQATGAAPGNVPSSGPAAPMPGSVPAIQAAPVVVQQAPQPPIPSSAIPSPGAPFPPSAAPQTPNPYSASHYAPMPGQAPVTPQQPQQAWGGGGGAWGNAAPPSPYGYGAPAPAAFGYQPGMHVTVTWANGQRYPGTIHQVSGTRCLVVFPDGQQHWVEMHYVTPV